MTVPEVVHVTMERPRGPLRAWEDALGAPVGRADPTSRHPAATECVALDPSGFVGRIEHGQLGDAVLARVTASASRFLRALATPAPSLPSPALFVLIPTGTCRLRQNGRACELTKGGWSVIDTRQPFEYALTTPTTEAFALAVPRPADPALAALFERGVGRHWDSRSGLSRLLHAMVCESFEEMRRLAAPSRRCLGAALTALAWQAVREQIETPAVTGQRGARLARVKDYIEAQLDDPELSVETIAHGCDISVRSLHRLFAHDTAGSVSSYLWQRRLARCAAALRDPRSAERSITDICFKHGFNSTSHFARLFKNRFGVPPRDYRNAA